MSINQQALAARLNTSERTINRHRQTVETRYGIEIARKVGRETVFNSQYLYLVEWSVKGLPLPETIEEAPDFLSDSPEVVEAVLEPENPVGIQVFNKTVEAGLAVAPTSVSLGRLDTSALEQQTVMNRNSLKTINNVLTQAILHIAKEDAQVLGKQVENIYSAEIANAKKAVLENLVQDLQS